MRPDDRIVGGGDADALARSWLVRLKSGEATQRDLDALAGWRAQSAANEDSFRQAVRLWDRLGPALGGGATLASPVTATAPFVSRRWVLGGTAGLASAAIAVIVAGGAAAPAGARVFETRKGERRHFRLDAELSVDLNTDSRLYYWPDAAAPRVDLDRGEALVSAACGNGRRLSASVDRIEMSGQIARFLLRADGAEARVSCLDGRMTVKAGGEDYVLVKGRSLDFAGGALRPAEAAVAETDAAWRRDLLVFEDRPLGEVLEELNRYRNGRVYLLDGDPAIRITGVIHLDRVDLAVDHIARSIGMKVSRLPGGIALLRS